MAPSSLMLMFLARETDGYTPEAFDAFRRWFVNHDEVEALPGVACPYRRDFLTPLSGLILALHW